MEKYLSELNKDQRKAVEYNSGPSIIIAGPGSGKTKVLTNKLAYLIKSGVNPFNILALTFTNKSAKEMKNRVKLIPNDAQLMPKCSPNDAQMVPK